MPGPAQPLAPRLALLVLLPVMGWLIHWDGQRFDPGLLDFKQAGPPEAGGGLLPAELAGMARMGAVRQYDSATLYEYINGHAEFFLSAGFKGLSVGDYGPPGARGPTLTVDLYDMGKPLHAFGVLSEEMVEGTDAVEVGDMGFAVSGGLSFTVGPYYLRLSAFDEALDLIAAGRTLAEGMATAVQGEGLRFSFPDFGPVSATRFIKEGYRGMAFLNNVVERAFEAEPGRLTAFLITGTEAETSALWKTLQAFLAGEEIDFQTLDGGDAIHRVDDPYEGPWLAVVGRTRLLGLFPPLDRPELLEEPSIRARIEAFFQSPGSPGSSEFLESPGSPERAAPE